MWVCDPANQGSHMTRPSLPIARRIRVVVVLAGFVCHCWQYEYVIERRFHRCPALFRLPSVFRRRLRIGVPPQTTSPTNAYSRLSPSLVRRPLGQRLFEGDALHRVIRDVPKPVIAAENARFGQNDHRTSSFDAGFGTGDRSCRPVTHRGTHLADEILHLSPTSQKVLSTVGACPMSCGR